MIEILPDFARLSLVRGDLEKKELELIKARLTAGRDSEILRKSLRSFGKLTKHKIILSLDSGLATTIYSSVSLIRDNPRDPIDESDLDNLVSQAVWKFFDRQRAKVAAKMGINDFDVLLADVRIGSIKLDGHRVVNPLGFRARSVEVQLNQTFVVRDLINELKKILPVGSVNFITEAGTAWSHLISRVRQDEHFLVANIFKDKTSLFLGEGFRLSHRDNLAWGETNLIAALQEVLKVSLTVAAAIVQRYLAENVSPYFGKRIENFLMSELAAWVSGVDSALSRTEARLLYIHASFELPKAVFSPSFRDRFNATVRIQALNSDFISEHYHFQLKYRKGIDQRTGFAALAAVVEASFLPQYDKMSQMAKKRVRWLSSI